MRALLSKFIARLAFFGLALILLPLAVQNRQMVSLTLDPMALLSGNPSAAYHLPLFVALLLALLLGLGLGYLVARLSGSRLFGGKKSAMSVDLAASPPLRKTAPVLEERQSEIQSRDGASPSDG